MLGSTLKFGMVCVHCFARSLIALEKDLGAIPMGHAQVSVKDVIAKTVRVRVGRES